MIDPQIDPKKYNPLPERVIEENKADRTGREIRL